MNRVSLIGNVGNDPVFYGDGINTKRVARVSLATTERGFTKKDGTAIPERTEWHTIVFFGSICQVIEKYVKTGARIAVEGSIHYCKWEDENKNVKYSTEIWCSNMELLDSKKESTGSPAPVQQYKTSEEEQPLPF
jgi:single-strand DNA-binding protein